MKSRLLKRKLIRARIKLNQTIQQILDINRRRKGMSLYRELPKRQNELDEELKVLNKIAEQQARLVKHYERSLGDHLSEAMRRKIS